MTTRHFILFVLVLATANGCSSETAPDSNTGVFQTPEKAAGARRQKLELDWQELALKIANAERPDIKTIKAPGFAIKMSADGVERTIDLAPLTERLTSAFGREREPIREYLAEQVPPLDRARLKALGFERAKRMLHVQLANTKQTAAMTLPDTKQAPITNRVVIDLNWAPVVRWPGTASAQTPVDAELVAAWGVSADQVSEAALANLRAALANEGNTTFETVDLPGMGRYGSLRGGADAAYLILPEWLAGVRKAWGTTDDLVISLPSRTTANFLERKNEKLFNRLLPDWTRRYAAVNEPMISTLILAGDGGLTLLEYKAPSTKPATAPATKPRVYIVN